MAMKHFENLKSKMILKQWKHLQELALCGLNSCRGTTHCLSKTSRTANPHLCKPNHNLIQNLSENSTSKRNTCSTILQLRTTYSNVRLLLTTHDDANSTFLQTFGTVTIWWLFLRRLCYFNYFLSFSRRLLLPCLKSKTWEIIGYGMIIVKTRISMFDLRFCKRCSTFQFWTSVNMVGTAILICKNIIYWYFCWHVCLNLDRSAIKNANKNVNLTTNFCNTSGILGNITSNSFAYD